MILFFILLQFSFPALPIIILSLFFYIFFVLILLLLCFLLLSLCPSFPLSHLHPAADFLHITLGLLTYFFIYLCQIARPFYCIYMHTYMYLYTYITVFNTNFCFKTEFVVSGMHYENALRNLNSIKCKMTNLRSLLTVVMVVCIRYGKPC